MFDKVLISDCIAATGSPPFKGKWIDHSKGDAANPRYRSRWVAKQFRHMEADEVFAATPPIESLRVMLSDAMPERLEMLTWLWLTRTRRYVCSLTFQWCVSMFKCDMTSTFILSQRRAGKKKDGHLKCAKLRMSMCDTKAAAPNWKLEVRDKLLRNVFCRDASNPDIYVHATRKLRVFIHGDAFVTSGRKSQIKWFRALSDSLYEVKHTMIGPREGVDKQARILHRIVEYREGIGLSFEADPKHCEAIIQERGGSSLKPLASPHC